jgi:hypothetical protein
VPRDIDTIHFRSICILIWHSGNVYEENGSRQRFSYDAHRFKFGRNSGPECASTGDQIAGTIASSIFGMVHGAVTNSVYPSTLYNQPPTGLNIHSPMARSHTRRLLVITTTLVKLQNTKTFIDSLLRAKSAHPPRHLAQQRPSCLPIALGTGDLSNGRITSFCMYVESRCIYTIPMMGNMTIS